jgi:hypothetical protein
MEHKVKSETTEFELDVYNNNEYTQIRVQSGADINLKTNQMYIDMKPKELRQFIECLELLEKQTKL